MLQQHLLSEAEEKPLLHPDQVPPQDERERLRKPTNLKMILVPKARQLRNHVLHLPSEVLPRKQLRRSRLRLLTTRTTLPPRTVTLMTKRPTRRTGSEI